MSTAVCTQALVDLLVACDASVTRITVACVLFQLVKAGAVDARVRSALVNVRLAVDALITSVRTVASVLRDALNANTSVLTRRTKNLIDNKKLNFILRLKRKIKKKILIHFPMKQEKNLKIIKLV